MATGTNHIRRAVEAGLDSDPLMDAADITIKNRNREPAGPSGRTGRCSR